MFSNLLKLGALTLTMVSAQTSPCPDQQSSLLSSAQQFPTPSGDLGSYFSSFSSAHNGVFSGCQDFTSPMPSSLTSPYQAWVTSVSDWSTSLESTISAAQSTCQALVVPIVIALPRCPSEMAVTGSATATGSSSASATSSTASSSASSSSNSSSGASLLTPCDSYLLLAALAGMSVAGAIMIGL